MLKVEASPFDSSPLATASPRLFWQGRDPASPSRENQSPYDAHSPILTKRGSIEKLKQASRVKNSNMFAKEQSNHYDPSKPVILDRPLASGRPLSTQVQSNAYDGQGLQGLRGRNDTVHAAVTENDLDETVSKSAAPPSPSRNNVSPAKSSLSKKSGFNDRHSGFDPETGIWNDDDTSEKQLPEGRGLHRHAKSVTFDQAPPQVNEYEMTTPVPSSVASGSREGSYDSAGDEEEVSFERGSSFDRDDSFDASLEDTEKTPVVLPEDWRFMSPDIANTTLSQHEEDVFDDGEYGSPEPSAQPGSIDSRPHQTSLNSVDSNGERRPLPPLPQNGSVSPERQQGFSNAIERMSNAQRSLPTPPQPPIISKSEIRRMSGGSMSLEERLRLMMLKEQDQQQPIAEQQRERRMRRAGSKDPSPVRDSHSISIDFDARDGSPGPAVVEEETESPKISRDSIIRRLRSEQDLHGFNGEKAEHPHLLYDPDVPIPSLEDPTQPRALQSHKITIKQEEVEETDLYSIPDLYAQSATDSESEEGTSQYSQPADTFVPTVTSGEGGETPRAQSPARGVSKKSETSQRPSLPDFTDFGNHSSFDLDLSSYLTPPVEEDIHKTAEKKITPPPLANLPDLSALRASIQQPFAPAENFEPPHFSHSRDHSIAEPGTPDSVIRHPTEDFRTSEIASPEATVKAPGARLNIRPSPAPADSATMAATRRQVSGTLAAPPVISPSTNSSIEPEEGTSIQEPSTSEVAPHPEVVNESESIPDAHEPTKKRVSSLVHLDLPRDQSEEGLGLGLEAEFDRVLEAQKVEFELSLQRLYHPFHGRFPPSECPDPKEHNPRDVMENIPLLPRPQGARAYPGHESAIALPSPHIGMTYANRSPLRQRGYLMRQNTKVVVASERASQDEKRPLTAEKIAEEASGPDANGVQISPRKISQPTWTAEPWVGKSRRKSIRVGGDTSPVKRKPVQGPAPPLPGLASNVEDALPDEDVLEDEAEDLEDGAERGRLFVKVMGVKELNLPLPDCKSCIIQLDSQKY